MGASAPSGSVRTKLPARCRTTKAVRPAPPTSRTRSTQVVAGSIDTSMLPIAAAAAGMKNGAEVVPMRLASKVTGALSPSIAAKATQAGDVGIKAQNSRPSVLGRPGRARIRRESPPSARKGRPQHHERVPAHACDFHSEGVGVDLQEGSEGQDEDRHGEIGPGLGGHRGQEQPENYSGDDDRGAMPTEKS